MTTERLGFGLYGSTPITLRSWVPKLRRLVERVVALETDKYLFQEVLTNKTWLGQPVYRKVLNFGLLPNATTTSVPHGIKGFNSMVSMRGMAKRVSGSGSTDLPIPYADTTAGYAIELLADETQVDIVTAQDYSAFTGTIILEYTRG